MYRVDWKGCGTALVTPFDEKGRIDFRALTALVKWQICRARFAAFTFGKRSLNLLALNDLSSTRRHFIQRT